MENNYQDFSDEIKSLITEEDAKTFDEHNNNVMYQMAPLLREKVGIDKAEELYKEMAAVVFRNQPVKVIGDICEDILCVFFTPISAWLSTLGVVDTADDWNLYCVSQNSRSLSNFYYHFYLYSFIVLFVIACAIILRKHLCTKKVSGKTASETAGKQKDIKMSRLLWPGFLLCLIISLWFSIGDGAPPNDRYALLHYIIWTLWALGTFIQAPIII